LLSKSDGLLEGQLARKNEKPLESMRKILHQGVEATAALWPDLRWAFGWVEEAAEILKNRAEEAAKAVKSHYQALGIFNHRSAPAHHQEPINRGMGNHVNGDPYQVPFTVGSGTKY
jgi:hypothetical protein